MIGMFKLGDPDISKKAADLEVGPKLIECCMNYDPKDFKPGDVVSYNNQEWEVAVAPDKTPLAFQGEDLVWAYKLPEKTIMRYFYPKEIVKK